MTRSQACISTLSIRNMVVPFNKQNLLESACPMDDVLGHIAAQLAEFKALKDKKGPSALATTKPVMPG